MKLITFAWPELLWLLLLLPALAGLYIWLLRRKRNILEEGARRLLQKETLVEDELQQLFGVAPTPALAPT